MKKFTLTIALLLATVPAWATYCADGSLIAAHPGGNCSVPIPVANPTPKPVPAPSTSSANNSAVTSSQSGAVAGSVSGSNSSATTGPTTASGTGSGVGYGGTGLGGSSTASGSASGTNSLGSVDSGNTTTTRLNAYAISLPAPVFVPPLPLSACPQASSEAHSWAFGWNLISKADAFTNTDACTLITVYNTLLQRCKWASARKVLNGLTKKALPDYAPESSVDLDLTEKECRDWQTPAVAAQAAPAAIVEPGVAAAPAAPVSPLAPVSYSFFDAPGAPVVCPAAPTPAQKKKHPAAARKQAKAALSCSLKG